MRTCEFREVVGLVEPLRSLLPPALVHQLVPLRHLVPQGAPCVCLVAERHAAVHASRRLQPPHHWLHTLPYPYKTGGKHCEFGTQIQRLCRPLPSSLSPRGALSCRT